MPMIGRTPTAGAERYDSATSTPATFTSNPPAEPKFSPAGDQQPAAKNWEWQARNTRGQWMPESRARWFEARIAGGRARARTARRDALGQFASDEPSVSSEPSLLFPERDDEAPKSELVPPAPESSDVDVEHLLSEVEHRVREAVAQTIQDAEHQHSLFGQAYTFLRDLTSMLLISRQYPLI